MPRHHWLIALGACASVLMTETPVRSQATLPLTQDLNQEQLEEQGLRLIEDAIQLSRFQQFEWAIPRAKLATQLVPNRFEAWYILGTLLVQEGEFAEGIRILKRAESIESSESGIYSILGAAYFQSGQYELAVPELETALALGDESIEVLFDLGNAQLKLKDYAAAIATYERSLDLQDDFWPALNNIGLIYYEQGKIDAAIDKWQQAIEIDPSMAEPQLAVAVATYMQGNQEEGLTLAREALELDGRYGEIEFLDENLWGENLLQATEIVFATPSLKAVFEELTERAFQPEEMEP
ncbi:tetratricopeptide repeat protein [[Limnothrix rosea] IAM M-220]|uniref:tetratricopeptide repeat protein n=1 Tax=[Limnothrix rosea] IAM M-220 TaxID=454133 RepID=UPI000967F921|nr:tetratricopeptide repeat protein [[Limnothrix rosea] IAM M-220]OKH16068.1 cytochrome c biogenesis factor [[Limnothrix rosea] IAM M-220]